jgi:hypothetical protein
LTAQLNNLHSQLVIAGVLPAQKSTEPQPNHNINSQHVTPTPDPHGGDHNNRPAEVKTRTPTPTGGDTNSVNPDPSQRDPAGSLNINKAAVDSSEQVKTTNGVSLHDQSRPTCSDPNVNINTPVHYTTQQATLSAGENSHDMSRQTSDYRSRSFSEVASAHGPWATVDSRRNRNKKSTPQQSSNIGREPYLRGVKREASSFIYIQGIYVGVEDTESDVKAEVRKYATTKGLRVMAIHIITNKYCEDVVGCKLAIPESQVETALSSDFWPVDMNFRRWKHKSSRNGHTNQREDFSEHSDQTSSHNRHGHSNNESENYYSDTRWN